ncbi:hypothetical protein PMAYCL1PPCAC_18721, partial [Pristionchus mayeri]
QVSLLLLIVSAAAAIDLTVQQLIPDLDISKAFATRIKPKNITAFRITPSSSIQTAIETAMKKIKKILGGVTLMGTATVPSFSISPSTTTIAFSSSTSCPSTTTVAAAVSSSPSTTTAHPSITTTTPSMTTTMAASTTTVLTSPSTTSQTTSTATKSTTTTTRRMTTTTVATTTTASLGSIIGGFLGGLFG